MNNKHFRHTLAAVGIALAASFFSYSSAFVPKTETKSTWMRVTDLERTDTSTLIGVRLMNYPKYWVNVASTTRLMATEDTTRQYRLIATENIDLDKHIWMPESGCHDGVLVFEKVPEDVKTVDLVESDPSDIGSCTFGIRLDEPETRTRPDMLSLSDLPAPVAETEDRWTGLDPRHYADLSFYDPTGTTHIKGIITDYSRKYGVSTFSIRTKNDFTGEEKVYVGDIRPDGSFELTFPLPYPQFDYFQLGKNTTKELFLIPGDTLSLITCMSVRFEPDQGRVPEYLGYERNPDNEAAVINLLADSLVFNRYGLESLYMKNRVENTDSMMEETYRSTGRLASLLDSVVNDLPNLIGNLPVSTFAKDMLATAAIGRICIAFEDIEMDFRTTKGSKHKVEDGKLVFTEGESLDGVKLLWPWLKHKNLIYDNPLILCNGWIIPNRWMFNSLTGPSRYAAEGMEKIPGTMAYMTSDNPDSLYAAELIRLDSIGLGDCFATQFVRAATLIDNFRTTDNPTSDMLRRNNRLVADAIRHSDYPALDVILLDGHNDFVKDVMIAEGHVSQADSQSITITDTPEGQVLEKIIAPYRGNYLYLDFWGIGCGPCRAGMVSQKPILEELSDKPFKALYIANGDESKEACEKWLRKEDIKGEHIFVSGDDWNRLGALFNFSAIPFGVLIDKEGNVLKTHYDLHRNESFLETLF